MWSTKTALWSICTLLSSNRVLARPYASDVIETIVTVARAVAVHPVIATIATSKSSSNTSASFITSSSTNLSISLHLASPSKPTTSLLPSSTSAPPASGPDSPFLRGVNLGGWLVLEKWMDRDTFTGDFLNAVDQYSFDSIPGAEEALQTHWSTYFTEDDIKKIAATGINALRIPIGFWAYDNTNTPYIKGADAFLEKAIGWARGQNMHVWVDLHGSPGSQNGFDSSGHTGSVEWQQSDNLARSIEVLKTMATKYGSLEYAGTVVGLELANEPISWGNNKFSTSQSWAKKAFKAVKAVTANPNLIFIMHDCFEGPLSWTGVAKSLDAKRRFGIDQHLYQLFTDSDNTLTQAQHITEACGLASHLASANSVMPVFAGEWSAKTNICVNPDGSTTPGTSCSTAGCQCQSADFDSWNPALVAQARRFAEAQLDVFESSSSGYFMWAAKGPGGWGFLNGIKRGVIPNPITSRKFPGQCDGYGSGKSMRPTRASLGAMSEAF